MRRGAWATSRAPSSRWTWRPATCSPSCRCRRSIPNSFSEGIGRTEWKMLSEDDHIPLLNKVAQGLYPSGSTIKPAMALAFLKQGVDPKRRVIAPGGYQIGNRYLPLRRGPRLDRHALGDRAQLQHLFLGDGAASPIPNRRPRWSIISATARNSTCRSRRQRFGTMPSPKWLEKKYHRKWQGYDSANTSIGQGYVLINPMQLAVMPARLASGKLLQPRLLMARAAKAGRRSRRRSRASRRSSARPWPRVVNEHGTAVGVEAAARRYPDGRKDRHRTGVPARRARPPRRTGRCATTPCSSPSHRPTSRATRSAASSSMAASAHRPRPRSSAIP